METPLLKKKLSVSTFSLLSKYKSSLKGVFQNTVHFTTAIYIVTVFLDCFHTFNESWVNFI